MTHPQDLVVPKKLKALLIKIRDYQIKQGTGGATEHLKKIISARDAYVHAGLVSLEAVDEYIGKHDIPEPIIVRKSGQRNLW